MSIPQVTPITGLPQVDGWSQVIVHPSRLLICVLSVAGKNANSVGKTLAEHVAHFPLEDSSRLHNALLDLLQSARNEDCRLQLACVLLNGEKNVLATYDGSVFLHRNHRVGKILVSQGDLKIVEGARVTDDVFVLATRQAVSNFPELKNVLHKTAEDLVPQLVADLHSKENSSLSALAWVENGPETEVMEMLGIEAADSQGAGKTFKLSTLLYAARNLVPSQLRKNPLLLAKRGVKKLQGLVASLRRTDEPTIGATSRLRPRNFLVIAAALILLLAGIILWKRHQINQEVQALQPKFDELQQQFDHAQSLATDQPIDARAQVREVMRGLEDLIVANPDKKQAVKILKEEYQAAQTFAESISGTEAQGPLEPFFDLRLAEASFVAQDIAMSGDTLLALDAAGSRIVLLDTKTKQTQQIALENIGTARAIAADEDDIYVLADGLHSYSLAENHAHTLLKAAGDSDRSGTLLGNFISYLYVFNPEARNIFRYLQTDNTLSDAVGWLADKQALDFPTVEAMAIDGDIWLTTQAGEIKKYTQGRPQNFTVGEMPTPFDSVLTIATNPDSEYLFVLEKNRNRLVVLSKDGSFFKEIVSESFAAAQNIATSLTEKAVFVVSGSLVYKISL